MNEDLEKKLSPKRKSLLYCIRENNWNVIEINDDYSDWAYDEKWVIKSTRENFYFQIVLWFFKHDGVHDGMNSVIATNINSEKPNPYAWDIQIHFNSRNFDNQLTLFISEIHKFRLN